MNLQQKKSFNKTNNSTVIGPISKADWIALGNTKGILKHMREDKERFAKGIDKYTLVYKDILSPYMVN